MKKNIPDENRYAVRIEWSDENEGYMATVPALPTCVCVMPTEAAAMKEIRALIRAFLEFKAANGHPLPEPDGSLEDVRRMLPIVNLSKLARVSGVRRTTLSSRLRRGTAMPEGDAARVRKAIEEMVLS